jgi:hypothetical protein
MKQKNSFDDIIPPGTTTVRRSQKRSIRDIPVREKKQNKIDELLKETAEFRAEHQHAPNVHIELDQLPKKAVRRATSYRLPIWVTTFIILILVVVGSIFFFHSAKVTIALKSETVSVDLTLPSSSESTQATGTLPYKVLPIQKQATKEVSATGAPVKVDKKASGTIVIYNNYNTSPQPLIATTRFETSDGLIFRLDKAVTVPGVSKVGGQTVPGSVEAVISADQTGTKYNIDKTDFTIPGFKGSPKYQAFYARSKTMMSGGFSGSMPQVSTADLKAANDELKQTLTAQAIAEIESQKADNYVFFKDGINTSYTSEIAPSTTGKAIVTGKLTLEGLIFERTKVEELIATSRAGEKYHFDNLESLVLTVTNQNNVTSFISNPVLSLKFSGNLTTGQSFDEEALKLALADKSKSQLQSILSMYPEITQAKVSSHPFWSRSFPRNPESISIIVTK